MYIKFRRIGITIIILFLIIYLGSLINWVFTPLLVFVQTLFVPIILSGLLYYIFRPLVKLLSRKFPRTISILLLYIGVAALFVGFLSFIIPEIQKQFTSLVNSMPRIISEIQLLLIQLQNDEMVQRLDLAELFKWEEQVGQIGATVNNVVKEIATNTFGFVGAVFNILILVFVVPFILFYLLKEGEKLPNNFLHFIKKDKQEEVSIVLHDMDTMLSHYIKGILIVCSSIGILCYIAYSIIGLEYALILAMFAMITNVIPYVGPWIGAAPAVFVGLLHSPTTALIVLIVVAIIQQIESIFIQPQVMGKKLSIHPVTVLFLVLVAGRFAGIPGMLLAIPTYAVGKVIVTHSYRLWKVRRQEDRFDVHDLKSK